MNPLYGEFWLELGVGERLEKLASVDDPTVSSVATVEQARHSDAIFEKAMKYASSHYPTALLSKEAAVFGMTQFMLSLRDSRQATGEKLAASNDVIAEGLVKLATAVYVDQVITEALPKLAGEAQDRARLTQLLGREYAVELMRSLLA